MVYGGLQRFTNTAGIRDARLFRSATSGVAKTVMTGTELSVNTHYVASTATALAMTIPSAAAGNIGDWITVFYTTAITNRFSSVIHYNYRHSLRFGIYYHSQSAAVLPRQLMFQSPQTMSGSTVRHGHRWRLRSGYNGKIREHDRSSKWLGCGGCDIATGRRHPTARFSIRLIATSH